MIFLILLDYWIETVRSGDYGVVSIIYIVSDSRNAPIFLSRCVHVYVYVMYSEAMLHRGLPDTISADLIGQKLTNTLQELNHGENVNIQTHNFLQNRLPTRHRGYWIAANKVTALNYQTSLYLTFTPTARIDQYSLVCYGRQDFQHGVLTLQAGLQTLWNLSILIGGPFPCFQHLIRSLLRNDQRVSYHDTTRKRKLYWLSLQMSPSPTWYLDADCFGLNGISDGISLLSPFYLSLPLRVPEPFCFYRSCFPFQVSCDIPAGVLIHSKIVKSIVCWLYSNLVKLYIKQFDRNYSDRIQGASLLLDCCP